MTIHPQRTLTGCVLFAVIAATGLSPAWADDLDSIRYGEAARSYAAGSIQHFTPQDGVVNVITGDNQTVGNRMRLGMNDVFYLKLKNPADVAIGDLFTVYKRTRKVFHPATGKYMGYLVTRLAVVQVVQVDDQLTTARALRAFGSAAPGDPVVKFSPPSAAEAAVEPVSGDINGMVIELQADIEMTLVAQRNIVYLDRGWEDGVRAGDRMDLVRYGGGAAAPAGRRGKGLVNRRPQRHRARDKIGLPDTQRRSVPEQASGGCRACGTAQSTVHEYTVQRAPNREANSAKRGPRDALLAERSHEATAL